MAKANIRQILLQMVKRDTIEFENDIPIKHNARDPSFSPEEEVEIQVILEEMLHKQIIKETTHEATEFVSPIFIVKNPDGGIRLIWTWKSWLNLSNMNSKTIINMVTRNSFMATIDLKDAYYSIAAGGLPGNFQGRGGFLKWGHFDRHLTATQEWKAPQGKILEIFFVDTLFK